MKNKKIPIPRYALGELLRQRGEEKGRETVIGQVKEISFNFGMFTYRLELPGSLGLIWFTERTLEKVE